MHKGITGNFYGISAARFTLSLFLVWLSVNTETVAQNFWEPTNGPHGGRINAIAITHVGQIFLGTDGAGVFSSTTNGANWSAMNTGLGAVDVRAFAIKGDTIFAGLNNFIGLYNFAGLGNGGIYRSTNAGRDWMMPDAGLLGIAIRAMVVNSIGHLFAGTESEGVFRSTNNGNSWKKINHGLLNLDINVLAVNRDGHIFAGAAMGVFQSTDNGENWTYITADLGSINVSALAINSSQHIFVGAKGRGIFRSKDHGKTWVQINNRLTSLNIQALAINANGHIFVGTAGDGVFRSINDGQDWEPVEVGLKDTNVLSLAISNTEDALAGTFSHGVFLTTNNGASWAEVNNGLTAFVILRFFFNSQGDILAATAGGGVYRSLDLGESWEQVNTGLEDLFVTSFAMTKMGDLFAGTAIGVFRSIDNGGQWTKATADSDEIVVSALATKNDTIFAATADSNGVLISTDNGETWKKTGAALRTTSILSLALNGSGHIFVGTSRDGIFRSTDDGVSWINVARNSAPSFPPYLVLSLATNSHDTVFAGLFGGGVIRSGNNGNNWTSESHGLPILSFITSLAIDSQDVILAGIAGEGVYRSEDTGENWTSSNLGLPPRPIVTALAINSSNQIFAGIAGERVFRGVKPAIAHTPVARHVSEQAISIQARITDASGIAGVTLNYRRGGDANFIALPMSVGVDSFKATIPADYVDSRGIEYFIIAVNANGITNRNPSSGAFSVQIQVNNVIKSTAQPHGDAQNAYRLISVPLEVENKDARAVLEDDLGQYKKNRWRLFELLADQSYTELPNVSPMAPGKAFWLIVKDAGKVIKTGSGKSNPTSAPYSIVLHPRWNFIANPFNFTIPMSNVRLKSSGESPELRFYEGSWNDRNLAKVDSIRPFEGYAVFHNSNSPDSLLVDPDLSSSTSFLVRRPACAGENCFQWSVRIFAQCQEARDVDNVAAVAEKASKSWDEIDSPEPPIIGEYVSVYFPHKEWNTLTKTYCLDARPEPTDGDVWALEVKTNIRDKVNLTFEGVDEVPPELEVWLVDDALKITQNLRETKHYAVAGSEQPKQLKLVVGKHDFVGEKLAEAQAIPTSYELSQNFPNPFNPATTIRYGLPKAERVTLKIYNLLGAEVATLVDDEQKPAGYHAAIWDGRDKGDRVVASGVYVYRMRAGNFSNTKKLAIVK